MSRLQTRRRLRKIADRRRQASNNNNGEHTLLDQDIVIHNQNTPTNPVSETHPLETKRRNGTTNTHGHEVPRDVITIYSSSEDEHEQKEDLVDVWALRQHQAGDKDPRFLSSSIAERRSMMENVMLPLDGAEQKPESSSWPTSHPCEKLLRSLGTKLLQWGICGRWAHCQWCDNKNAPQTTPTDNNDNIRKTPINNKAQETIYIDNGALPYYEYSEVNTTENKSPPYLGSDYSDDDGQRECGLGGYENCPDNPANHPIAQHQEDNFEENHPDPNDRWVT